MSSTNNTAVAVRPSLSAMMASQYGIEPAKFIETIKATVMPRKSGGEPSPVSAEDLQAFCMVAHEYGLNPFLKEIHAFPNKAGGITPIVGVDGWAKIMNRRPEFDGVEFDAHDEDGKPHSVTARIFIKGRSRPVSVTEYYSECQRGTEPWRTMPRRMLRHKALIQCARVAFGFSGIHDEDEARDIIDVTPATSASAAPAPLPQFRRARHVTAPAPEPAQAPPTDPQPDPSPTNPPESPEGSSAGPLSLSSAQNELRLVVENAGYGIDQFNRFSVDAGYATGEFASWSDVPDALASKLARARVGLLSGIKEISGGAQ